jgi:hypothetical protein
MHICFLNRNKKEVSDDWHDFLETQIQDQNQWQKELKISKEEAERGYQFMQCYDRLSLILVQRPVPVDGRAVENTSGISQQRYDLRCLENKHLTVEPWLFEDSEFTVNVERCHLSDLKYDDNQTLIKALKQSPISSLEWIFSKK